MHDAQSSRVAESSWHRWVFEDVVRIAEGAERIWRQQRAAQLAAADALQRSAESQDQTAKSYEDLAQHAVHSECRDEYLKHAARHREFAELDRRMATQVRRLVESHSLSSPPYGAPANHVRS